MTALMSSAVTQFGCHQHQSITAKAQFGGAKPHICQFSGCCAQFSSDSASTCDTNGGDCKDGLGLAGVVGTLAIVVASVFVGKRVLGTVFGTASTGIRDFFSRLVTGKGLVEKAQAASGQAQQYAKKVYEVGFNHGAQWWQRVELYFANLLKK